MYTFCHPVYSNSSKVSFISRSSATVFLFQDTDRAEVIYTRGCLDAVKEWFKENMIIIGGVAVGLALLQVIYLLEITFLTMLASQWHPIMLRSANGLKHLSHKELLLGSGLTWKMGSERIWKKSWCMPMTSLNFRHSLNSHTPEGSMWLKGTCEIQVSQWLALKRKWNMTSWIKKMIFFLSNKSHYRFMLCSMPMTTITPFLQNFFWLENNINWYMTNND